MLARNVLSSRSVIVNSEVLTWASAVFTNGGSVSAATMKRCDDFIAAEKASGSWGVTSDYWLLWGENAVQSLTSLKQRRLASAVNSPTHTPGRGYTFDGVANYIDTGFSPSAHGTVEMTGTSLHLSVYERTELASNSYAAGLITNSLSQLHLRPRTNTTGNVAVAMNSSSVLWATASATGIGGVALTTAMRRGATVGTDILLFKRGISQGSPSTPATAGGTTLPTHALAIGALNNVGTMQFFRATQIGFVSIGGARSDAQELATYNAVQAFATSIGANV